MSKLNQSTTGEIQKEQLFLVQLERELTNVLNSINDNLNTLKVEELQIRSNAINITHSQIDDSRNESYNEQVVFNDNPETVNRQELDLDILLSRYEDEEDEDN